MVVKIKTKMNIRIVISVLFGTIVLILFAFAKEDSHAEIEANNLFVETVPIIVSDLNELWYYKIF